MLKTYSFSYTASSSTKAGIWTVPYRYNPSIISIKYRPSSICISRAPTGCPEDLALQLMLLFLLWSRPDRQQNELGLSVRHCSGIASGKPSPARNHPSYTPEHGSSSLFSASPWEGQARKLRYNNSPYNHTATHGHPGSFGGGAPSRVWHSNPKPIQHFPGLAPGQATLHCDTRPSACLRGAPRCRAGRTTLTLSFAWTPVVLCAAQAIFIFSAIFSFKIQKRFNPGEVAARKMMINLVLCHTRGLLPSNKDKYQYYSSSN